MSVLINNNTQKLRNVDFHEYNIYSVLLKGFAQKEKKN